MPVSNAKIEGMAPNSVEKREVTRKQGQCQKCLTKVPIGQQYTVVNDLDAGTVVKRKDAGKREDKSHYCGECADVRVSMKTSWLENQRGQSSGGTKKGKGKPKGKAKAKKAAPKKTAKKAAPKKAGKKAPKKAKAKSGSEPF